MAVFQASQEAINGAAMVLFILSIPCFFIYKAHVINKQWLSWPTVEQYLSDNQKACRNGMACEKCRSRNIWQKGWTRSNDERRIHYCKTCNTTLYRTNIN